ncbi:hypothetical protein [Polynucleobacter necessarius]|uniref:hypothetical protein n=1 Tax=Polynucleobacter necessarius TaxID=576610 RepID=UPI000E08F423|nr:hypothetical protein [Polynucleobacter necessarius]HAT39996.1 hypothetical protein [Polynucleobacter sp.]
MKTINRLALLGLCRGVLYLLAQLHKVSLWADQQSDGTIGVHAPKGAKESEVQEVVALAECKKLGKRTASILESRKTVNDRFPLTYIYMCR